MRTFDEVRVSNKTAARHRETLIEFLRNVDDGEPDRVMEMCATFKYDRRTDRVGILTGLAVSAPDLTPTDASRFPWSRWLRVAELHARANSSGIEAGDAFALNSYQTPNTLEGAQATRATSHELNRQLGRSNRPGRVGHEPGFYEAIAERWKDLSRHGHRAPARTIAEEQHASIHTVNGWLRHCRAKGLLPPSNRGRYGKAAQG